MRRYLQYYGNLINQVCLFVCLFFLVLFQTMEQKKNVIFVSEKITEKNIRPAIDAKKIKNRKLPKNDKLHFVRITWSYFCGVALSFQTPNHQSPVSDAEFTFHWKLPHTYHLLIFGMFSLNGRFFLLREQKVEPQKTAHKGYMWKAANQKSTVCWLGIYLCAKIFGSDNLQPRSFSRKTKHPLRQTPPKALSTPKREKSWPFHSAKPVWYWSTSCSNHWTHIF